MSNETNATIEDLAHEAWVAAQLAPGEWVEWQGGECPIADGAWFEFRFRDGELSGSAKNDAPVWDWSNRGDDGDIVAYRILP